MSRIVILKTGATVPAVPAERGDFEDWIIAGMGLPPDRFHTASVYTGEPLPGPASAAAVVVTGSPAMVSDREPWSEQAAGWLRDLCGRVPILGICYGHQLLAHALGGEVGFHPGGREIGTTAIRLSPAGTSDPLLAGLPASFPAHVSHSQSVLSLPPDCQVLAANDFESYHALRFMDGVWGLQFHPEFDAAITRAYIHERASTLREEGLDPERLLAAVRETPEAESVLRNFAGLV